MGETIPHRGGWSVVHRRIRFTQQLLSDVPTLRLWRRSALPHGGGLQPQAEAVATGVALKEEMQALGAHLAKGNGLGS